MNRNTNNKLYKYLPAAILVGLLCISFNTAHAQQVSTGVDLYSTYVWRGVAYSGPSLQPYVEFSSGGFAIGAWGSQGYDGFQEMDLYAGYSFDFGLSLGVTDYYYPGSLYFDYGASGSHAIEINGGYVFDNLSVSGNYIVTEGGGSAGGDLYFEMGYTAGGADLFVGGGDGWHSADGEFAIVNVGIVTSKEIRVSESFTLPVSGSAILNPDTEQFYILIGISL